MKQREGKPASTTMERDPLQVTRAAGAPLDPGTRAELGDTLAPVFWRRDVPAVTAPKDGAIAHPDDPTERHARDVERGAAHSREGADHAHEGAAFPAVDLDRVRIHAGADGARAAKALGANAFSVGDHVVFGAGQYAPHTPAGRRLVAHELAHVAQHQRSPGAPAVVHRQPDPATGKETLEQVWTNFQTLKKAGKKQEALDEVKKFLDRATPEDLIDRGEELYMWLLDQKQPDLAVKALKATQLGTYGKFIHDVQTSWGNLGDGPQRIYERGKQAAENGDHDVAIATLTIAAQFVEMNLHKESQRTLARAEKKSDEMQGDSFERRKALAESATFGISITDYYRLGEPIALLRKILSVYPDLQRKAIDAKDSAGAAAHAARAKTLIDKMKAEHIPEGLAVTMMTAISENSRKEQGYALKGKTGPKDEEVVTPLPGTPTVEELGNLPTYTEEMGKLVEAIGEQQELEASLHNYPEIQKLFPKGKIDLGQTSVRLKVWAAMYKEYQKDIYDDPFASVLALMERYLRAFTSHTGYNIRDFGKSYLESEFPTDLADRAVRDCGVYALTVAYEVYKTAREATPRLPVDFQLYSFVEHVALVIFNRDNDTFFVANNDRIHGPNSGTPTSPEVQAEVARIYGDTLGRGMFVAPTVPLKMGSTSSPEATFKHDAWLTYQAGTAWGFEMGADKQKVYKQYYDDMKTFDKDATGLQEGLDVLGDNVKAKKNDGERKTFLDERIPTIFDRFNLLAGIFDTYLHPPPGSPTSIRADPRSPAASLLWKSGVSASYLEYFKTGKHPGDPMSRLGMALMLHERLGGALTAKQKAFIGWLRKTPEFAKKLDAYNAAGRPLDF